MDSLNNFKELMMNMQLIALALDTKGRIHYSNPFFLNLSSYTEKDLIGKSIFDFLVRENSERINELFFEGLQKGEVEPKFEYSLTSKTGKTIHILWNNTIVRNDKGQITYILCIGEDISHRKRIEDELSRSEDKFNKAFHNSPDAIIIVNTRDETIVEVNENMEKITGYSRDELVGNKAKNIKLWASEKERQNYISILKEKGRIHTYRISFKTKSGRTTELLISSELYNSNSERYALSIIRDVSELRKATEILEYQKLILSEMETMAKIGAWEFDIETGEGSWTDEVARIHDLDPDTYTNKTIGLSFYSGEDRKIIEEAIYNAINNREPYDLELQIKSAVGNMKWIHTIGKPIIENDKVVKLRGTFQDITESRQEKENLLKSETNISTTVNHLPLILYRIDKNGIFTLSIGAGLAGLGLKANEVVGQSAYKIYRDFPQIIEALDTGLKGEKAYFFVTIGQSSYDNHIMPVKNLKGDPDGIIGVAMDISKRIAVEEALRASEKKYRNIFNNIQDVFYQIDSSGKITEISDSVVRFSGYSREEMLGRSVEEFYANPADREELIKEISKSNEVWDYEIKMKTRDGDIRHASLNAHVLLDENSQPVGIEGSLRDIEERKRFEEELIKAKEKAEQSDKLKTAFFHNISHEIRTPMNAIIGFTQLLRDDKTLNTRQQGFTEIIENSSNQLLSIIEDIVNISRIEAKLVNSDLDMVNINTSMEILFRQFSVMAENKAIKFEYELSLSNQESLIRTDGTKFIQVFTNLLNNAFKFTESGYIRFGYDLVDSNMEFYVSDTGIGISPEEHSLIFNTFYQVQNSTSRLYEGTGLGLSICKAYVELLGGKIWLESEPEKGTSFYFTLPYQSVDISEVPENKMILPDPSAFKKINTILVAEDDNKNFELIEIFLNVLDTKVIRASNGFEAVEKCNSDKNIDLVLMDLKMPLLDGYEALKQIREFAPKLPVIAQSAYAFDEEAANEYGFNAFISKPFSSQDLLETIGQTMKDSMY